MKSIVKVLLFILCTPYLHGQAPPMFKKHSLTQFKNAGMDMRTYAWNNSAANQEFTKAQGNFRASDGLLAGGLASGFLGSGSIIVGTLNTRLSPSISQFHTPLIWTGIGLNLVAMPVCFILRDVMNKRAIRHIQSAKSKLANP